MQKLGVHSEAGKLRTVLVCRPGLAHQRLTPGNAAELLFDDVLWVHEAQKDHYDFVLKMRERGVEVLDLHELLAETLEDREARAWLLDRRITANDVGVGASRFMRPWLDEMAAPTLAERLIGGIAILDLPKGEVSATMAEAFGDTDFVLPPLPNTMFQRDPSCWIYNGVTCNPMYWRARKPEALLQRAVYKLHPRFKSSGFHMWWGDSDENFGASSMEGGDVMPLGKGVVLIGMGERTTAQAVYQVADQLFKHKAATRVIGCLMPKSRAAMHLDTVFSLLRPRAVHGIPGGGGPDPLLQRASRWKWRNRSAARQGSSARRRQGGAGLEGVARGGNRRQRLAGAARAVGRRQQRGRARAGRGGGLRPQQLHEHLAAQGRCGSHHGARLGARPRPRRRSLHDLPDLARPRVLTRPRAALRESRSAVAKPTDGRSGLPTTLRFLLLMENGGLLVSSPQHPVRKIEVLFVVSGQYHGFARGILWMQYELVGSAIELEQSLRQMAR
jgi:N-dimethylarginine dimethylaminohydrolase